MRNERSLVFFLIFCILLLTSCSQKMESTSFTAMNTYMTVKSYGKNAKSAAAANQLVQREVERLEKIFSTTIEDSEVYRINNSVPDNNGFSTISVMPETTPEQSLTQNFVEDTFVGEEEIDAPEDDNHDGLGFDIF